MKIESTKGVLSLDEATLCFNVEAEGESWSWEKDYRPCFLAGEEKVFFSDAASIRHEAVKNGIGKGIRSSYSGFTIAGEKRLDRGMHRRCFLRVGADQRERRDHKAFLAGPHGFRGEERGLVYAGQRTPGLSDSQYLGSSEPPAAFQGTVLHCRRLHVLVFPDPGGKRLHRHRPHALEWFH